MKIVFFEIGEMNESELSFAVISALYKGKWVYVRHKERKSWEIPGGHRELNEGIETTAKRELYEETGAKEFSLFPICDYSMDNSTHKLFGRLFIANIFDIGTLPNSEIIERKLFEKIPDDLTYPEIQPLLYKKTISYLSKNLWIING